MALNIGENIKKLRAEKGVTQEQLAEHLSITYQSVSKWENNITSPDLYLIPEIAAYFEVLIDELFKSNMKGYKNKAQRLMAIYENDTSKKENFDKANAEYEKIFAENKADGEDMQCYGYLHECLSYASARKAEILYKQAIASGNESEAQLMYLLSKTSRNEENIENREKELKSNPNNIDNWGLLVLAYDYAEMYEQAWKTAKEALEKFPNDASLLHSCGDLCSKLQKYDEAFWYWNKSIELNPNMVRNYYSIAYAYRDLKKYNEAIDVWEKVLEHYKRKGLDIETELPKRQIARLQAIIESSTV